MPVRANAYVPPNYGAFTAPLTERKTLFDAICYNQFLYGLNEYDVCLCREKMLWDEILDSGGLQQICCPRGRPRYTQSPWVSMPKEGRRFKPIGTLLVSTAVPFTATDILVMSERVPIGYNGVISDVVCEIEAIGATGFLDGSGDITWRLKADGRPLRDMGNLQVQLGSLTAPSPVSRGMLRVYSHDLLQFFVNFKVGAEARINPAARIVCSITGWFWPR